MKILLKHSIAAAHPISAFAVANASHRTVIVSTENSIQSIRVSKEGRSEVIANQYLDCSITGIVHLQVNVNRTLFDCIAVLSSRGLDFLQVTSSCEILQIGACEFFNRSPKLEEPAYFAPDSLKRCVLCYSLLSCILFVPLRKKYESLNDLPTHFQLCHAFRLPNSMIWAAAVLKSVPVITAVVASFYKPSNAYCLSAVTWDGASKSNLQCQLELPQSTASPLHLVPIAESQFILITEDSISIFRIFEDSFELMKTQRFCDFVEGISSENAVIVSVQSLTDSSWLLASDMGDLLRVSVSDTPSDRMQIHRIANLDPLAFILLSGDMLFSFSDRFDGAIYRFDETSLLRVRSFYTNFSPIRAVAQLQDQTIVVSCGSHVSPSIRKVDIGIPIEYLSTPDRQFYFCRGIWNLEHKGIVVSGVDRTILLSSADDKLKVMDSSGLLDRSIETLDCCVHGDRLCQISSHELLLFDLHSNSCMFRYSTSARTVLSCSFDFYVCIYSDDCSLTLFNLKSDKSLPLLRGKILHLSCMKFSPFSTVLLLGTYDQFLLCYDYIGNEQRAVELDQVASDIFPITHDFCVASGRYGKIFVISLHDCTVFRTVHLCTVATKFIVTRSKFFVLSDDFQLWVMHVDLGMNLLFEKVSTDLEITNIVAINFAEWTFFASTRCGGFCLMYVSEHRKHSINRFSLPAACDHLELADALIACCNTQEDSCIKYLDRKSLNVSKSSKLAGRITASHEFLVEGLRYLLVATVDYKSRSELKLLRILPSNLMQIGKPLSFLGPVVCIKTMKIDDRILIVFANGAEGYAFQCPLQLPEKTFGVPFFQFRARDPITCLSIQDSCIAIASIRGDILVFAVPRIAPSAGTIAPCDWATQFPLLCGMVLIDSVLYCIAKTGEFSIFQLREIDCKISISLSLAAKIEEICNGMAIVSSAVNTSTLGIQTLPYQILIYTASGNIWSAIPIFDSSESLSIATESECGDFERKLYL